MFFPTRASCVRDAAHTRILYDVEPFIGRVLINASSRATFCVPHHLLLALCLARRFAHWCDGSVSCARAVSQPLICLFLLRRSHALRFCSTWINNMDFDYICMYVRPLTSIATRARCARCAKTCTFDLTLSASAELCIKIFAFTSHSVPHHHLSFGGMPVRMDFPSVATLCAAFTDCTRPLVWLVPLRPPLLLKLLPSSLA